MTKKAGALRKSLQRDAKIARKAKKAKAKNGGERKD